MTARKRYYVEGVELVGVDGLCECCQRRPAIGQSISGLRICPPCAKDAREAADAIALEHTPEAA